MFTGWIHPSVLLAMKGRRVIDIKTRESYGIKYPVIVMEGGFEVAAMSDDEGNDGASLQVEAGPEAFMKKHKLI